MSDIHELIKRAKPVGQKGRYDDIEIQWRDVFPEGATFCPFQPPHTLPDQQGPNRLLLIRLFHPCNGEKCTVWDGEKKRCGART